DAQTGWLTTQMDLAALSGNSIHLVVAGAGHDSLLDNQSDAAVSGQAIAQVITPPGAAHRWREPAWMVASTNSTTLPPYQTI
ncbi:MAG TPA: hypothetical protein VES60_01890, partial [Nakamurella sp.]|nr:hypothetical protein [Nakamurella sp.]